METKNAIKSAIQRVLGFERYLKLFAWYKIKTLRIDRKENDFFIFLEQMPSDGIVLDVGANIGIMTFYLSRRLSNGRVVAFEPMPDNVRALRAVVSHFGLPNVTIEVCALGDHDGEVEMVMPFEGGARQQGLSHVVHHTIDEHNEGFRTPVPLRALDSFPFAASPHPKVVGMKIDVENFESFVLDGAKGLLRLHRPLLYIELWNNQNRQRALDILEAEGYGVFINLGGSLVRFDPSVHRGQNFICRPN